MTNNSAMAEVEGAHTLRFIRRIDASPERVWQAITDAAQLRAWSGMNLSIEPFVGGRVIAQPGEGWVFDFEEPRLLRFSAADPARAEDVALARQRWTISYELIPDGSGTRIVFVHRFLRGDQLWGLGEGWHGFLDQLLAYLATGATADGTDEIDDVREATLAAYRVHVVRQLRANARVAEGTDLHDIAESLFIIAVQLGAVPDYSTT